MEEQQPTQGPIGTMVKSAGSGVIGGLVDRIFGKSDDRRQIRQQKKMQALQIKGQKEMGKYNQNLAIDTWNRTNYEAQRQHMEKAGLNVGLMYEGGGAGGTTSTPTGAVSGGSAAPRGSESQGMAMQMGMQLAMQQAQIANINANTEKTKVDTAKTAGVDTEAVKTGIENLKQATNNAEMQNKIMEYEREIKAIEANTAGRTQEEVIQQVMTATKKLKDEARSAKVKGNIDEATEQNLITGADLANKETQAKITATQAGTKATEASTEQTKQNTKNLQQDEINKILANQMKENGVEPTDNAVVRMMQRWLGENNISIESLANKMKKIGMWMKGEYGEQSMKRLEELMKE